MSRFGKIFSIIIISLSFISHAFAASENKAVIELSTSKTHASIGENLTITVTTKEKGDSNFSIGNTDIPGIKAFEVHGTSTSTQMVDINGATTIESTTSYSIVPTKEGIFTLGPVLAKNSKSNTISIKVGLNLGEKADVQQSASDIESTQNQIQETDLEWTMKDWLRIGGIGLGALLIISFFGLIWYEKRNQSKPISNIPAPSNLSDEELVINSIRKHLRVVSGTDTESLTFRELIKLENSPDKQKILKSLLSRIEQSNYGKKEMDPASLESLAQEYFS